MLDYAVGPIHSHGSLRAENFLRPWSEEESWEWGRGRDAVMLTLRMEEGTTDQEMQAPLEDGKGMGTGFLLEFQKGTPCQHPDFCQRLRPDFWPTEPQESKCVWF